MSRTLLVTIAVVLVVIAAGGFMFIKRSTENPQSQQSPDQEVKASVVPQPETNTASLKELLTQNNNEMCIFETTDPANKVTGTIYVSSGKMRGDYTVTDADNKTFNGTMINDGTFMYTWSTMMPQGIKFASKDFMDQKIDATPSANQSLDPNKEVNYKCQGWNPETEKFTPPSDVKFMDYSQTMKQMQTQPGGNTNLCQTCNSLPADQQAACKKALKCS